jgi:hypothetical protein
MEVFWIFVAIVVADIVTTIHGIRVGLEDIWFGRRIFPLFVFTATQIAGFYVITLLLPLVPYMAYVVYSVLVVRVAVVIWNIYLIIRTRKTMVFSFPFFSGWGFWRRIRSPRGS